MMKGFLAKVSWPRMLYRSIGQLPPYPGRQVWHEPGDGHWKVGPGQDKEVANGKPETPSEGRKGEEPSSSSTSTDASLHASRLAHHTPQPEGK